MINKWFKCFLGASLLTLMPVTGFSIQAAENKAELKPAAAPAETVAPVNVTMKTSEGDIKMELYPDKAPITVKNFLVYVDEGTYNDTIFHRVIDDFMIQGGGFTTAMQKKAVKAPIKNEATNGLKNDRGTIAMARTGVVDSATNQFFINVVDNAFLNHSAPNQRGYGYCVFGKVSEGMDIVDKIKKVKTAKKNGMQNVPVSPIKIISITRD